MKSKRQCAVCQVLSEDIICELCQQQWDQNAVWVRDLIEQEQHWRVVDRLEDYFTDAHISVNGQVWVDHSWTFDVHLLEQADVFDGDVSMVVLKGIDFWATMGGLTVVEQHAYEMMKTNAAGKYAAEVINDMEHKHITQSAYRRRRDRVIHKIRDAMKAGEIDTDEH